MSTTLPSSTSLTLSCLFTKHKTQKHKKWQDGKLIINPHSGSAFLYPYAPQDSKLYISNTSTSEDINHSSDNRSKSRYPTTSTNATSALDSTELPINIVQRIQNGSIVDLELDSHLITIEGPFIEATTPIATQNPSTIPQKILKKKTIVSNRLQNKFRIPTKFIPTAVTKDPTANNDVYTRLGRKRPLQPGEYEQSFQNTSKNNVTHTQMNANNVQTLQSTTRQNNRQQPSYTDNPNYSSTSEGVGQHPQQINDSQQNENTIHSFHTASSHNSLIDTAQHRQGEIAYESKRKSNFVENDFNPSHFYEEEEDDDDDDDDNDEGKESSDNDSNDDDDDDGEINTWNINIQSNITDNDQMEEPYSNHHPMNSIYDTQTSSNNHDNDDDNTIPESNSNQLACSTIQTTCTNDNERFDKENDENCSTNAQQVLSKQDLLNLFS